MTRRARRLLALAGVLAFAYAGVCLALYLLQDRLLFYPARLAVSAHAQLHERGAEPLELASASGAHLRGWLRDSRAGADGLLLYFGGNAEEVSRWMRRIGDRYPRWRIAAFNYRGFGHSEGRPGEAAFVADAVRIFDRLAPAAPAGRVVLMGRSMGSSVAVQLAARRPVAGVVLISPFDSIRTIARRFYPLLPVGLILRHPFDSLAHAPQVRAPALMLAGAQDRIVPPELSRKLYDAWGGPKQWRLDANADHYRLLRKDASLRQVQRFLDALAAP